MAPRAAPLRGHPEPLVLLVLLVRMVVLAEPRQSLGQAREPLGPMDLPGLMGPMVLMGLAGRGALAGLAGEWSWSQPSMLPELEPLEATGASAIPEQLVPLVLRGPMERQVRLAPKEPTAPTPPYR